MQHRRLRNGVPGLHAGHRVVRGLQGEPAAVHARPGMPLGGRPRGRGGGRGLRTRRRHEEGPHLIEQLDRLVELFKGVLHLLHRGQLDLQLRLDLLLEAFELGERGKLSHGVERVHVQPLEHGEGLNVKDAHGGLVHRVRVRHNHGRRDGPGCRGQRHRAVAGGVRGIYVPPDLAVLKLRLTPDLDHLAARRGDPLDSVRMVNDPRLKLVEVLPRGVGHLPLETELAGDRSRSHGDGFKVLRNSVQTVGNGVVRGRGPRPDQSELFNVRRSHPTSPFLLAGVAGFLRCAVGAERCASVRAQ